MELGLAVVTYQSPPAGDLRPIVGFGWLLVSVAGMKRVACTVERLPANPRRPVRNIAAFAIFVASALGLLAEPARPNVDRREQRFARDGQPNEKAAAEAGLRARVPNLSIERHPMTGSPRWISARDHFLTSEIRQANP